MIPRPNLSAPRRAALARRFAGSTSGVASIEFAALGSVMMALFAGWLDVTYMVRARLYSDRSSMLMARAIASCKTDYSCAAIRGQQLMNGKAGVLARYPDAEIGWAVFARKNGAIKMCLGPMTYLESDIQTSALSILKDDDTGVAVYVKTKYTSFFPNYVVGYLNKSTGVTYRDYTVDVLAHSDEKSCVL